MSVLRPDTDLSVYTQADFDAVALQINQRPRETLDFETQSDRLRRPAEPAVHYF